MDDNPYDKDWVCLDDLMFYHRYDLPTPDTDEIYPRDSASNSGIEGYTLFNDGSHDFDGFGHPSFPKKPTINPMKRKRSASENSEDSQGIEETENTPPNFRNVPQDLVHYHPKKPRHTRKGTVTQGKYFDGRFKLFGDRRLLLELTRYTVRPDWGTAYPCYVKNLASYQRRPKRTRKTPLSNEEATTKLVKFLSEDVKRGTREHAAIHRLANGMQLVEWGPDLILKAFDDLDLVFFRGVLATRTQIDYMNEEDIFKDRDPGISILGSCLSLGFGRCHIVLNATRIFSSHDPFAQMWNTILHEMVHGYLNVLCDSTVPSEIDLRMGKDWSVGGHGHCFRRIITAVDRRFRKYFNMHAIASWEPFNLDLCGISRTHCPAPQSA